MKGFIDAEHFLSNLRKGEPLTDKIYYISFDNQKNSLNELKELKSRCSRLGYSFHSVEMYRSSLENSTTLFYLFRNLPHYYPNSYFENYRGLNAVAVS